MSTSYSELKTCSVTELKSLCKGKGLKVSGRKADLIDRLLEAQENTPKQGLKKEKKSVSFSSAPVRKILYEVGLPPEVNIYDISENALEEFEVHPKKNYIPMDYSGEKDVIRDIDELSAKLGKIQVGFDTDYMTIAELRTALRSHKLGTFASEEKN